jgi:hypothetical protein
MLKFMFPKMYHSFGDGAAGGDAGGGGTGAGGAASGSQGAADPNKTGEGAADPKGDKNQVPVAALQEERTKRQAVEAKMKQLESLFANQISYDSQGNVVPKANPNQPNVNSYGTAEGTVYPQGQQQTWEGVRKQLDEMWENDPRKAMQSEMTIAIGYYDQISTAVEEQMDEMAKKAKDFDAYRAPIRQYLRKLPMNQRANPGIVEAAYFLQKGQSIDQIIENERKTLAERVAAGESIQNIPTGGAAPLPGNSGARQYTKDEQAIAQQYGQTAEEYFGAAQSK